MSAAEPNIAGLGYEGATAIGILYEQEQHDIESRLAQLEGLFRQAVPADVHAEWRAYVGHPNATVARTARCADLIITGSNFGGPNRSPSRSIDTGELLVKAGSPVSGAANPGRPAPGYQPPSRGASARVLSDSDRSGE